MKHDGRSPPPRAATRDSDYWFPAKTFGWGWGPPRRWQGWLTLVVYVVALVALSIAAPPGDRPALFIGGVLGATALLVLVCLLKGEPPRWRWRR